MEHLIAANHQTFCVNPKDGFNMSPLCQCEGIFADFLQKFQTGSGQMKSVLTENDRFAKPSIVQTAPDVERTDEQTSEVVRLTLLHCLGDDMLKRRRYALVNYRDVSFITGGYDFDAKTKVRSQPLYDFVYDINKATCRAIPSFPSPGRVAFGIAPSEQYIIIIGGQTYDNVSLSSALIFDTLNIDQAPGVAISDNRVIVIGGYDIVAGETDMLSSHYQMDLDEKIWRRYADLHPPRARTLIICVSRDDDLDIHGAGGYTLVDGKSKAIDKIYSYNTTEDKWKKLTDIPDLQMSQTITVAQTKLFISEEASNSKNSDQSDIRPLRMYDFDTDKWTELNQEEGDDPSK